MFAFSGKNIYIGNAITNLKNPEEDNLVQFPSASYINITKAIIWLNV